MNVELYHPSSELKQFFRKEKDARVAIRIRSVYLAIMVKSAPDIAQFEKLWQYLRQHYWSNRIYEGYDHLRQAANDAWQKVCLNPFKIKSICRTKYIESAFV